MSRLVRLLLRVERLVVVEVIDLVEMDLMEVTAEEGGIRGRGTRWDHSATLDSKEGMDRWEDLETLDHPGEWEADQTLEWEVMVVLVLALVGIKGDLSVILGVLVFTEEAVGLGTTGVIAVAVVKPPDQKLVLYISVN